MNNLLNIIQQLCIPKIICKKLGIMDITHIYAFIIIIFLSISFLLAIKLTPTIDWHYAWILFIIFFGGFFGGIINHLKLPEPKSILHSMLMGLAASSFVPLFLSLVSSQLLNNIVNNHLEQLFVLFGYCLAAAITGKSFVDQMVDAMANNSIKSGDHKDNLTGKKPK